MMKVKQLSVVNGFFMFIQKKTERVWIKKEDYNPRFLDGIFFQKLAKE